MALDNPGNLKLLPEKPSQVQTLGVLTLVSGIMNCVYALSATVIYMSVLIPGIIATLGIGLIGLLCVPFFFLPAALGVFEIIYATKLMANPMKPVMPNKTIAILEICMILGLQVFGPVVGILALVYYDDQKVKDYFAQLNAIPAP
jgi:hypothetical protein